MKKKSQSIESQKEQIKKYLIAGNEITPIEALNRFGCFRLGARIYDLKREGMDIKTAMIYNGTKKYACYFLEKKDDNKTESKWGGFLKRIFNK